MSPMVLCRLLLIPITGIALCSTAGQSSTYPNIGTESWAKLRASACFQQFVCNFSPRVKANAASDYWSQKGGWGPVELTSDAGTIRFSKHGRFSSFFSMVGDLAPRRPNLTTKEEAWQMVLKAFKYVDAVPVLKIRAAKLDEESQVWRITASQLLDGVPCDDLDVVRAELNAETGMLRSLNVGMRPDPPISTKGWEPIEPNAARVSATQKTYQRFAVKTLKPIGNPELVVMRVPSEPKTSDRKDMMYVDLSMQHKSAREHNKGVFAYVVWLRDVDKGDTFKAFVDAGTGRAIYIANLLTSE